MTTLTPLLVEWIDRSHARISLPNGVQFEAMCDAGWRTEGLPDLDGVGFALFEDLLGFVQEHPSLPPAPDTARS